MTKYAFHEEDTNVSPKTSTHKESELVRFVMRYSGGLIKSKEQATFILLSLAFLGLAFTFYFILEATSGPQPVEPGVNPATGERFPDEI